MNNIFKNGLHIPILYFIFNFFLENDLFSYTLMMKIFSINYYYNYYKSFNKLTFIQSQIKPWVRFTDTGYIATLIYYFNPNFYPIAFNIHFTICIGYWCIMTFFGISDVDGIKGETFYYYYQKIMSYSLHLLPLIMLSKDLCIYQKLFDEKSLLFSTLWTISWFFFVLIPWKIITKDSIYTIFNDNVANSKKLFVIIFMLSLVNLSNNIGIMTSKYICN